MGFDECRVERDRSGDVPLGLVPLVELRVGIAEVQAGGGVCRVDQGRLGKGEDRVFGLAEGVQGGATQIESFGPWPAERERLVDRRDRSLGVAGGEAGAGQVEVYVGVVPLQRRGVQHLGCSRGPAVP